MYALDERRVLRRYRQGGPTETEARLMNYLADHDYPVPAVHDVDGTDMVLDRLYGRTMTAMGARAPHRITAFARTLAGLHNRLHTIPAPPWLARVEGFEAGSDDRVLHLDLHPDNVIMTGDGPVVIDWCTARAGEPGLDVASVMVLLSAMRPPVPWWTRALIAAMRTPLLTAFLIAVEHEATDELVRAAIQRRLDDRNTSPEEKRRLRDWSERIA
ncbi:hypothetical protein Pen01_24650 [Phytomonospora endophytica]|nr:hypothetical protein Pen01_24650 [Phytomonospora endophytica]